MHYLRHSWFDPTSLMSRNVQWDILSGSASANNALVEEYRTAFLSEHDSLKTMQPKRRGRQRQCDSIDMRTYPEQIAKSIGVVGNTTSVHALYAVKMGTRPVGLVGIRVEKTERITAYLDMLYVIEMWRKRGLATAIAEHAGRWAALGMQDWNNKDAPLRTMCSITTRNPVEASLANTFLQSSKETADLHAIAAPAQHWVIATSTEI